MRTGAQLGRRSPAQQRLSAHLDPGARSSSTFQSRRDTASLWTVDHAGTRGGGASGEELERQAGAVPAVPYHPWENTCVLG